MNTLRLADEVNALRGRVKELETEQAELQADQAENDRWISKLATQNADDAAALAGFIKHYNEHLEKNH